jgi:tRNA modification GTPase
MSASPRDPIVAIATAPGRGAVGIVRASGRNLAPLIEAICGRVLRPREATYLPFRDHDGSTIDQGLALHFPAPHSYTGEEVLELQAHGGPVVMQLLMARCLQAGAAMGLRAAEPGEFTQRAFLNDKLDLAQAEAVRSASRSLSGEFSQQIEVLLERLIHLRMLVEATLDFPEEEIDFLRKADAQGQLTGLQQQLQTVMARTRQGALLREGITVVIAGQPNAGKSSLLNALAGAELAIVTPIAGTTRDKIEQSIQIEGVPLHVVDTAGLRDSDDPVERIGIERAWSEIERADAVLFLHDLVRWNDAEAVQADEEIADMLARRLPAGVPVLQVWNKSDVAVGSALAPGLHLSAKTGHGLAALRTALLEIAGWQALPEGVYLARARHVQALTQVQRHLDEVAVHLADGRTLDLMAEELRLAQNALNEITGAFGSDDLLGVIFSRFCIGK